MPAAPVPTGPAAVLPATPPTTPAPGEPQPSAAPGAVPQAVFLDLDNTIIAGSSALAFARTFARHGLIDRGTVVRGAWAQLLLVLSGADASTMDTLRRRMTLICQGWEVERVRAIVAETLQEVISPLVYPEAVRVIERHREQGAEIVLLSASGLEVVGPIAELVGIDRFRATTMRIEDGRYAGEIEFYCYGDGKAEAAREIAAESGFDLRRCAAYSDSITDLPLLEAVGSPAVVNPDRELRAIARERGWPVLGFVRVASRRDRLFRLRDRLSDRAVGRSRGTSGHAAGPGEAGAPAVRTHAPAGRTPAPAGRTPALLGAVATGGALAALAIGAAVARRDR
ncbi:HAD family hydrolase [Pseudonocardia parietis]|uniref:HAD superfamily hydrolase (TIGR01490 family) n=1 Tax=Pseudonocardia parietis TaxID=570936 RepID=A0ABS4VKF1_9PSEU|nr:HAD-IB family hydrolase [Pseudonocardia parietis]MBP2364398.1 HAD superfamily hydrolase (TIGR01490 family) [Pseudonocardia parietis]